MTTSQFLRLEALFVAFSLSSMLATLFNVLYDFQFLTLKSWPGWAIVHQDFGRIDFIGRNSQTSGQNLATAVSVILLPATGLMFFLFFGLGEEGLAEYQRWWRWSGVPRVLEQIRPPKMPKTTAGVATPEAVVASDRLNEV